MLSDRFVGALCLGFAALAATWGGDVSWPASEPARPAASAREPRPAPVPAQSALRQPEQLRRRNDTGSRRKS
jgi:hypothetical protein